VLFVPVAFAELIANDKPILVQLSGELLLSRSIGSIPKPPSAAISRPRRLYRRREVQCLIKTGGRPECWDDPAGVEPEAATAPQGEAVQAGWMLWPPIPYHYRTINNVGTAPSRPTAGIIGWARTTPRAMCWRG
jgi:microcin C transport system permease protein